MAAVGQKASVIETKPVIETASVRQPRSQMQGNKMEEEGKNPKTFQVQIAPLTILANSLQSGIQLDHAADLF